MNYRTVKRLHYFQMAPQSLDNIMDFSKFLLKPLYICLGLLKQISSDFQLVVGSQAQSKLLASVKNTISDRHIVQKNFNR